MTHPVKVDITIIGGGIAGLWLLNRLRSIGYSVVLLESDSLGAGQTHVSQGIIHGGIKYALQGKMTNATQSIAEMPFIWKQCLNGQGEINLSGVKLLSSAQYLFSPNTLAGKLGGFFANLAMNSQVRQLTREQYPSFFQTLHFKGQVYALDEVVLDVRSLLERLSVPHQATIFKIPALQSDQLVYNDQGEISAIQLIHAGKENVMIQAKQYIFAAGAGNELLAKQFNVAMQRRPLHMVMVKATALPFLYAHCIGMSATPRMTITAHPAHDGGVVWYLGGQIAEEGVSRDSEAQISCAQKELKALFPWIDFKDARWATVRVDRAEGLQDNGQRPDSAIMKAVNNAMVVWPTKLALAPQLTHAVIAALVHSKVVPSAGDLSGLQGWPQPTIAQPIWDELL